MSESPDMSIAKNFSAKGGACDNVFMDFGVGIIVKNNSNEQFLLRFNSSSFHAVDDVGTVYTLAGSGMQNSLAPLGVDINYTMLPNQQGTICVDFNGKIPLPATYLLITEDWINGVGPITFRKDL